MKKLGMLIIILLASFNLFSQTDIDSSKIQLNNKVAKLVVKELITFDALKIEAELLTGKITLLENKVENLEGAQRHANQLMKIKAFAPNLVNIGKFCKAFLRVSNLEDFSYIIAYKQLEKNTKKFDKCQNQEDWDEAMVKAYNFNLKKPSKKISIKKDGF